MSHWFEKHGTTSDWVGIGVGVLVAIFTILLFVQTQKSTDAAIDAATASKDAVKEAQRANNTSERALNLAELQFKKSIQDDIDAATEATNKNMEEQRRYEAQFDLQKKSAQAQIDALNEQQKQFAIGNEPYLQITSVNQIVFEIGKPISGTVNIANFGNYPVKLIHAEIEAATKAIQPDTSNDFVYRTFKNDKIVSSYISKGNNGFINFNDIVPLNNNRFEKVTKKIWWVYVYGYCIYINLITNKPDRYNFMMRFNPNDPIQEIFY